MGLRGVINSGAGKAAAGAVAVISIAAAAWAIHRVFGRSDAAVASQDRVFICTQTGRIFRHRLGMSDTLPIRSPHSGKPTGYPAELCYWTADGHVKRDPTALLLNSYRGDAEPTFCPDCGRLVVRHNPYAAADAKPPPTRQEHKAMSPSFQGREVR